MNILKAQPLSSYVLEFAVPWGCDHRKLASKWIV